MSHLVSNRKIATNLIMSVLAQIISIVVSFILGFIVPKYIDEFQYSYWQTFILYVGYVGVFHFGLLDGIVLRYSQYDFDELDKPRIRSQFQLTLNFVSLLALIGCLTSVCTDNIVTKEIVILVSIGIITKQVFGYTSYSFQITNRITKYAVLVIAQRAVYAIYIVILLACRVNNFMWYCIADLFGDVFAIFLGAIFNRGMYFGKALPIAECFKEAWLNISSGIMLMVANFSSSLLVGGAKMMIQWRWDELVFGQVSFSFSVSNLFLTFVTAISVVLFPSLKRMKEEDLPDIYTKIRNIISPLLFFAMIVYFPGCWILEKWLPNYSDSLVYLGILLPIIIFSSKVSLLTNNYLKAYRKEKLMLVINVASVLFGMAIFAIGAYILNDLEFVLYFLVAVIMLRSVASEIAVTRIIKKRIAKDFLIEFVMTVAFIVAVRCLELWWACLAYVCIFVIYAIIYRKSIAALLHVFINMLKRSKSGADSRDKL